MSVKDVYSVIFPTKQTGIDNKINEMAAPVIAETLLLTTCVFTNHAFRLSHSGP